MKSFDFNLLNVDFSPVNENTSDVLLVLISPENKVLLHEKSYYPHNTFRLLTGGVEKDESVQQAAQRELEEELGILTAEEFSILCTVRYFYLARICFTTFAVIKRLSPAEVLNIRPDEEGEKISRLKWLQIEDLPDVINQLENELPGTLKAWGQFRADQHKAVYNVMR